MPPAILYYAIPGFILLLSIEAWFSYREQKALYETRDTFSSLALGLGNIATNLITKALIFGLFTLLYRWRLFTLDGGPAGGIGAASLFLPMIFPTTGSIVAVIMSIGSGPRMSSITLPKGITWPPPCGRPGREI